MNIFWAITSWLQWYDAFSKTKVWSDVIWKAKEIASPITQAFTPAIKTAKSSFSPISNTVSSIWNTVVKDIAGQNKREAYYKPFKSEIEKIGLTYDDLAELQEEEKQQVISQLKQIGVTIPWIAEAEQEKAQEQAIQWEDWYSQKSYFSDQRPDEWFFEQAGKWIIRTPLTFAQNAISWPENIAQGSLNLLDKTLWEGALNPLLNVIWQWIKWDKYKDLPTWYNNVPSTNQYTENVASNIFGAGKEALTTNKSYSQANEELKQQQYKAGKDQGIGGALANIWGGGVSTAFNIMAPWASALFAWASEMPGTQYVTQWLGALTQAPIDYVVNKAGGTEETANQIWTMANLALPLARNKVAWMKPTSTPGKLLQKTAITTADAIINPLWAVRDLWTAVFSKNPRSVEDIAGNILQPYKWMTENLDDATNWIRRVVEETGTKTSTYDGLLTAIKNTQNKYGKMLSDSLGQITTSTKSQLFDTALTQLAKIYEWVSSSDMKATLTRINELWKKNITTGLTPAEKNEVKILHTKANNLFNEKGKETGWFSSDDLRWMRRDMVAEINKEASDAGITNIPDINKAYWELSDARTLAENQVANLKSYKGRTPPPTTMAKITNMIVDFPIIKQVFSDPTRAVASALFKNLRWDKINPIEVQWRLSGFLKELKKAGAKAEEIKKIEQIMLSMKLLPEKSSAKIPLTQTEQDKAIIKQSKPSNITKNGNLDNSVSSSNNNRTKSVKKPVSKPLIKNESKMSEPVVVPKKTVNTPIAKKSGVEPKVEIAKNELPSAIADLDRNWILQTSFEVPWVKIKWAMKWHTTASFLEQYWLSKNDFELIEWSKWADGLYVLTDNGISKLNELKNLVPKKITPKSNAKQQVSKPVSSDTVPDGYFKNAFWEIPKKEVKPVETNITRNETIEKWFSDSAKARWDKWDFTMKERGEATKYLKSNYKWKEYTIDWKKYKVDAIDNRNEQVRLIDPDWNTIRVKINKLPEVKVTNKDIFDYYFVRIQKWYKSIKSK